jgi:hypothetical protein
MRAYIAGPMTGLPAFNFPTFNAVAAMLRAGGHTCFNPAERDLLRNPDIDFSSGDVAAVKAQGFSLDEALRDDTHFICMEADTIIMLPGWENSPGAFAEWSLARALKRIRFIYLMATDLGLATVSIAPPATERPNHA